MSKLTLHNQHTGASKEFLRDFVARSGVEYIKLMDPPTDNPFAGLPVKVIGRTYEPDEESIARIWQGRSGAHSWFRKFAPIYAARPWVHAWEGPNEPHPMWDPAFRRKLDEFTAELSLLMKGAGYGFVGHNWSLGWPDIGDAKDFANSIKVLAKHKHYLGLHEYAAPTMDQSSPSGGRWWTLRYRNTVKELGQVGVTEPMLPLILITEAGIDGGANTPNNIPQRHGVGWMGYIPAGVNGEKWYINQNLKWYDSEIMKDWYVAAAFIFTSGAGHPWETFNVPQSLAFQLSSYIVAHPTPSNPQLPPTDTPTILSLVGRLPVHDQYRYDTRPLSTIKKTIVHHTAVTPKGTSAKYFIRMLKSIARQHVGKQNWPGIAYHFAVDTEGRIYQLNPITESAYHAARWNPRSIGVVFLWDARNGPPPPLARAAMKRLTDWLGYRVYGHNDLMKTYCPGSKRADGQYKHWWLELYGNTKKGPR